MKKSIWIFAMSLAIISGLFLISSCEQVNLDDDLKDLSDDYRSTANGLDYNVSLRSAEFLVQSTEGSKTIQRIEPLVYDGDTLLFIFNFDEGWQVISGDKRTEPFLASDETGSLSTRDLDNPGVATWLSDKADEILYLKQNNPQVEYNADIELWVLIDKAAHFTEDNLQKYREKYDAIYEVDEQGAQLKSLSYNKPTGYRWVKRLVSVTSTPWTIRSKKGPLLQTKWGQGAPWSSNMPEAWGIINDRTKEKGWKHCPTGCTAVAMSQLLYYLHYEIGKPKGLYHDVRNTGRIYNDKNYTISFSRGNYNPNSDRWNLMKKKLNSSGYSSYVSDLMADVGNRVNMKYSFEASGAWPSNQGFNYYGISCEKTNYTYSTVANELRKGKPVIVVAWAGKGTYRKWFLGKKHTYYYDGHTWIIDGYRTKQKTYTYTYVWELVKDDRYYNSYNPYDPYSSYNPYETEGFSHDFPSFPGQRETSSRTSTATFLLMNWGWNGAYDYGEYSTGGNKTMWSSYKDYQYKKEIFYDFK